MNVLVIGITPSPINPILKGYGCKLFECADPVDVEFLAARRIQFAVSYRYQHIVKRPVIEYLSGRVINLHISLLPWNRGADPNLWSFLEDTPKGVTIHYIDEGLDTGDIIAQKEIVFDSPGETLATTYEKLNANLIELFKQEWQHISTGEAPRRKQPLHGSFHRTRDKEKFLHLLAEKGWHTPVDQLTGQACKQTGNLGD
jgi:methionyl-tRNA formyltransferase